MHQQSEMPALELSTAYLYIQYTIIQSQIIVKTRDSATQPCFNQWNNSMRHPGATDFMLTEQIK